MATWVLEFPEMGYGIGQANDIVRQHTPAGQFPPPVSEGGRLGYTVASEDYELISAIKADIESRGRKTFLGKT